MSIQLEIHDGVACVTLNRPEAMNAMTQQMDAQLRDIWPEVNARSDVHAVILTGAGAKAFCSGADIGTLLPYLQERARSEDDGGDFAGMSREPPTHKPIIAAINGICVAGGLELALACDLRIAEEHSVFALPEVRWGVIAGAGGITRLSRLIPDAVAMDMLLTAQSIDAARALQVGLVSELVPAGKALERAMAKAEAIGRMGPLSVRLTKEVARRGRDMGLYAALEFERVAFRRVMMSEDVNEGVAAFVGRRTPRYSGR
ncbi:MAG: enoyl-CoA hydratase/isomerase family protein [Betaproteobacteria bacterium]|nr:enoyl-CoA hydratase/isomerase family protein [Betaproteobacteria bacterium]